MNVAKKTHLRAVPGDDLTETFLKHDLIAGRESKEGSGTELVLTVFGGEIEGQGRLSCR